MLFSWKAFPQLLPPSWPTRPSLYQLSFTSFIPPFSVACLPEGNGHGSRPRRSLCELAPQQVASEAPIYLAYRCDTPYRSTSSPLSYTGSCLRVCFLRG